MNHSNYYDFKEAGGTPEDYLNIEVLPAIKIAEDLGFEVSTFSYPHGARDTEIISWMYCRQREPIMELRRRG